MHAERVLRLCGRAACLKALMKCVYLAKCLADLRRELNTLLSTRSGELRPRAVVRRRGCTKGHWAPGAAPD